MVFAHTEYDFANHSVGFEVFRFEDGQAVEHWDNIQARQGPNLSDRSMVDGPTESVDLNLTESNRAFIGSFVGSVLIDGQLNRLTDCIDKDAFIEHNPRLADGVFVLRSALEASDKGGRKIDYQRIRRVLVEGNFVLCVSEGYLNGVHSAFYDLFSVIAGKIVEHWDTTGKLCRAVNGKTTTASFKSEPYRSGEQLRFNTLSDCVLVLRLLSASYPH